VTLFPYTTLFRSPWDREYPSQHPTVIISLPGASQALSESK
jgi:hypothetical protein